jgi:hypothetical protein
LHPNYITVIHIVLVAIRVTQELIEASARGENMLLYVLAMLKLLAFHRLLQRPKHMQIDGHYISAATVEPLSGAFP